MNLSFKIGKIVGGSSKNSWSQTHVFLPEDEQKQKDFGCLLASFALQAKQEDLDIPSFGKEVILRFQEIYYTSPKQTIFKKLKYSIRDLTQEFSSQVNIGIAAAVATEKDSQILGYFAGTAHFQSLVLRQGSLVKLLKEDKDLNTASGILQPDDIFIICTSQFLKLVPEGSLKAGLEGENITEAVESLSPIIHGHSKNSKTAAVLFQVSKKEQEKQVLDNDKEQEKAKTFSSKLNFLKSFSLGNIKLFFQAFLKHIKSFKKESAFYIKDEAKKQKSKKTTFTIAIVLIGLLMISIFLGLKKQTSTKETGTSNEVLQEVSYRYEQAVSLEEINPLRSKLLLEEARSLINEKKDRVSKKEQEKLEGLKVQIDEKLQQVGKEYELNQADIFLDLSLVKEGFKGGQWAVYESSLFIFDTSTATILEVNLNTKAVEVAAGGEKLQGGRIIGAAESRIFVLTSSKILVVSTAQSEVIDEISKDGWGKIEDLAGFSSNAYLLDSQEGQIWKYPGLSEGLGSKQEFLKTTKDFSQAKSLAIDGSVWVVFSNSTIKKFIRGVEDNFVLTGLTKPFSEEVNLYTDENLDNLYVLDRRNTRIVIISKTGEYQSQYVWSGIAGASDILGIEDSKILLLAGERIYEIEIK
jgi:hypothetical protein